MSEKLPHNPKISPLAAFADGELEGQAARDAYNRLAQDPRAAQQALLHQQLRHEVGRILKETTPPAPTDLRKRVQALPGPINKPPHQSAVLARLQYWAPLAFAAVILLVALVSYQLSSQAPLPPLPQPAYTTSTAPLFNTNNLDRFFDKHHRCAEDPSRLNASFPSSLKELPPKLAEYLGSPTGSSLDLSRLGYEFVGAGRCSAPGTGSVQLLYRAQTDGDHPPTLSLWLRRYDGSLDLQPGKLYALDDRDRHDLLLVWRDEKMVYYLTGDSQGSLTAAADELRRPQPKP